MNVFLSMTKMMTIGTVASNDAVILFVVNRSLDQDLSLAVGLPAFADHRVHEHLVVTDDDLYATNTQSEPNRVTPRPIGEATEGDGVVEIALPPASWHVIRLRP